MAELLSWCNVPELLLVDDTVWIHCQPTGIRIYDFDFRACFPCRQPWERPEEVTVVSRCGAFDDYGAQYHQLLSVGLRLVNTPEQHQRASDLRAWHPLIEDLTPRSVVYQQRPSGREVAVDFRFPVFVKGTRQTSRHRKALSVIESQADFDSAMESYVADSILKWQSVAVREFVQLRPIEDAVPGRVASSFEFRTFWWKGQCAGTGRYWWEGRPYDWSAGERRAGLAVAEEAARRVQVPFLVVDIAMTTEGKWIVIECNDGQESGYAGVSPIGLWQAVIDIERSAT